MSDPHGERTVEVTIVVALEGGPRDLPPASRVQQVTAGTEKIKLRYGNGYEHFARCAPANRDAPVVFRWVMRTAVAE